MSSSTLSLRSNADYRRLILGSFVNNTGDWLFMIGVPAFLYTETGSGRLTALVVAAELTAAIATGPLCGDLADRLNAKSVLIWTNLAQAAALLPLLAVTQSRVWPAVVAGVLQGALRQLNDATTFAVVPRVVLSTDLVQANSANATAEALARIIGAPLAGFAVVVADLEAIVVLDGVSFIVVAWLMWRLDPSVGRVEGDTSSRASRGILERWGDVRRVPRLPTYLALRALAAAAFGMLPVLLVVFVVEVLSGDESTVGIVRGASAVGAAVASVVVGRAARSSGFAPLLFAGYAGLGLVALAFANVSLITAVLWVHVAIFAISGLANVAAQVGGNTAIQQLAPVQLLGRAKGFEGSIIGIGSLLGVVSVAALIEIVDVRVLLSTQGAIFVGIGVAARLALSPSRSGEAPDVAHIPAAPFEGTTRR